MNSIHPLATDMAKHLARRPLLDLDRIEEPWIYLRRMGFSHAELDQHIDAAIRLTRAERIAAAESTPSLADLNRPKPLSFQGA